MPTPPYQPPQKGQPFVFYLSLVSQADTKLFQTNPTLAAGDFKITKDGGALADLAVLPTVEPAMSKSVKVSLSGTEMTADNILMIASDQAGAQWADLAVNIQPGLGVSYYPVGAIEFTYTVTNSVSGDPIDGVEVWISTDNPASPNDANVIWHGVTDALGIARD